MHLSPPVACGSVVVNFLIIVGVCNCSLFCYTLIYVHSSIAVILMGKRELVALLNLSSWYLVMVERLFLAMPRGCLRFVIVVFPDHTHLTDFYAIWLFCWLDQNFMLFVFSLTKTLCYFATCNLTESQIFW